MYDAIHAVSNGTIPELSRGSSARGGEGDARPKGPFLRRAAVQMGWLLLFVMRNISSSATPNDLTYGGSRMAISRLVTEGDCLPSKQNFQFVCRVPNSPTAFVRRRTSAGQEAGLGATVG
jgi:hypothetical protein